MVCCSVVVGARHAAAWQPGSTITVEERQKRSYGAGIRSQGTSFLSEKSKYL